MKNPDRATVTKLHELPNIGKAIASNLEAIGISQPSLLVQMHSRSITGFVK